jgi:hypothetical protein
VNLFRQGGVVSKASRFTPRCARPGGKRDGLPTSDLAILLKKLLIRPKSKGIANAAAGCSFLHR